MIALKLIEEIKQKKNDYPSLEELYNYSIKLNKQYENEEYHDFFITLRTASNFIMSIYEKKSLTKILESPLWLDTRNITKGVYSFNSIESKINNIESEIVEALDEIEVSRDASNGILHGKYDKIAFEIYPEMLPNSMSLNILIQSGLIGIVYRCDEKKKNEEYTKKIKYESLFKIPTIEEYNEKYPDNFDNNTDLYNQYLDYIINNKENKFLDTYDSLKIVKYFWNNEFDEIDKILKNVTNKSKNREMQIQLAKAYCSKFNKNTIEKWEELYENSKDEMPFLARIALNNLINTSSIQTSDNFSNWLEKRKELNDHIKNYTLENDTEYDESISLKTLYNDCIKKYSGGTELGHNDNNYVLIKHMIVEWLEVYINRINFGLFELAAKHYQALLKILTLQFSIYGKKDILIIDIYYKLLLNGNDIINFKSILENIPIKTEDNSKIETMLSKITKKHGILNTQELIFIECFISFLAEKEIKQFLQKIESYFTQFLDESRTLEGNTLNRLGQYITSYIFLLKNSKLAWDKEKTNILCLFKNITINKNSYRSLDIRGDGIIHKLIYLFKQYKDDINDSFLEEFKSYLIVHYDKKSATENNNENIDYENKIYSDLALLYTFLNKKLPKEYSDKITDKALYLYENGKSLQKPSEYDIKYLVDYCKKNVLKYKLYIESKPRAVTSYAIVPNNIFNLLRITYENDIYIDEAKNIFYDFIEYLYNQEIINDIDILIGTLNTIFLIVLNKANIDFEKSPIDQEVFIKYCDISHWGKKITEGSLNFYFERAGESIVSILNAYVLTLRILLEKDLFDIEDLNRIFLVQWHQRTVKYSSIFIHISDVVPEKYKEILQLQIIKWICESPLNIGINILEVYKYIYGGDKERLDIIKKICPDIAPALLNRLNL